MQFIQEKVETHVIPAAYGTPTKVMLLVSRYRYRNVLSCYSLQIHLLVSIYEHPSLWSFEFSGTVILPEQDRG